MVRRISTVCFPHHCSSGKEPLCVPAGRELNWETLTLAGRCVNIRAMCDTLMLEIVPVVWKVECPELGEAVKDAVHKVHYGMDNFYCILSSSLQLSKRTKCVREENRSEDLSCSRQTWEQQSNVSHPDVSSSTCCMKGRVSWAGGGWRRCWAQSALWYREPLLYIILIAEAQERTPECSWERIEPRELW